MWALSEKNPSIFFITWVQGYPKFVYKGRKIADIMRVFGKSCRILPVY
jgi:hypothetical protein